MYFHVTLDNVFNISRFILFSIAGIIKEYSYFYNQLILFCFFHIYWITSVID